ncbi:ATP-binding protein [Eubacterium sp. 1001713B170207_170306_E7]|uniref:ATP-binding protein n=1 Tax=Eubacterium sp. 1001713B170207_170306_E7 TaxID=2787097 RepID=UPI001898ABF8|nr:ATP-binding protein [Eubacterium sp. 1001713B170207_170306_E7]
MSYELVFDVEKGDFEKAGEASRKIKRSLQQLGINSKVIRHIAIAGYEGEMNIAIHSDGGQIILEVDENAVTLRLEDVGPGIPNVDLAMTEGWSTASDKVREMGFGAGMGLPNMEKNADDFEIHSKVGEGTKIRMCFKL